MRGMDWAWNRGWGLFCPSLGQEEAVRKRLMQETCPQGWENSGKG